MRRGSWRKHRCISTGCVEGEGLYYPLTETECFQYSIEPETDNTSAKNRRASRHATGKQDAGGCLESNERILTAFITRRGYEVLLMSMVILHLHEQHYKQIMQWGCINRYWCANERTDMLLWTSEVFISEDWGWDSAHCSNATFSDARDWTVDVMDIECLLANEEITFVFSVRAKFACQKTYFGLTVFVCSFSVLEWIKTTLFFPTDEKQPVLTTSVACFGGKEWCLWKKSQNLSESSH